MREVKVDYDMSLLTELYNIIRVHFHEMNFQSIAKLKKVYSGP